MRILVADPISEAGIHLLRKEHDVSLRELDAIALVKEVPQFHALVVRSRTKVTRDVLAAGGKLKVVGRAGVGVDNIDMAAARELGIPVVNAPTAATNAVAELTFSHVLALLRSLPRADASMKGGKWEKKGFEGRELAGKVLGLLGIGRIGTRVAELGRAFGMRVIAFDPYVTHAIAKEHGIEKLETVEAVLEDADVLSIHVALTPETKAMIDAKKLALMKRTALLVNLSRGGIVDEGALARALETGGIAGAGLDVFETEPLPAGSPLAKLPNVVLTPHLGAATHEAQDAAGRIVAEQVLKVLRGEQAEWRVV